MFERILRDDIHSYFFDGKILMILGPRQVGKTTLVETLLEKNESEWVIRWSGDNIFDNELLSESRFERLSPHIGDARYIFIDEAQKIPNIWNTLKQLVDTYKKNKQIIITGSSSFHILDKTSEALTGRKITFLLFPISAKEYIDSKKPDIFLKNIESYLVYGMYPDILSTDDKKKKERYLTELTNSNLYRDILEFQEVKNSTSIQKLLRILALRIGSEISYSQIGSLLSMDGRTIERYIDLLEKSYIIFRLPPFFTNKEKELSKMHKIYFYDVGIRNALLWNFQDISVRDDIGKLWENYVIVERMKKRSYEQIHATSHFWRSYDQQEIDLIEESSEWLFWYECKWSQWKNPKPPALWKSLYPNAQFASINKENIISFI